MALITLRVLDGADRGQIFHDVATPLTIGREEGNPIQLNDDRISRFHLKIQEDQDKIVLTDLQSTNGTKINGESVQVWVLKPGDLVSLGRTVLLFGSAEEIGERLDRLHGIDFAEGITMDADEVDDEPSSALLEFEMNFDCDAEARGLLHTLVPPELPDAMSPGQTAQLAELLQYIHMRIRGLVETVKPKGKTDRVTLDLLEWQKLIILYDRLARYLRAIGEPDDGK
jgi:pSer/pThr/pTyr-binding forkhead associated (FHA) protein